MPRKPWTPAFAAAFITALASIAPRVEAAAMAPGERELLWDQLAQAPIHVQAEAIADSVDGFGFGGPCAVEAVVRRSFKGGNLLREGQRFRVVTWCRGAWYIHGRTGMELASAIPSPHACVRGNLFEALLEPEGGAVFRPLNGLGLESIKALSLAPQIDPATKPYWYEAEIARLNSGFKHGNPWGTGTSIKKEPPVENPPRFPTRDVTVRYTASSRPGEEFLASFDSAMRRVVVVPASRPPGAEGKLVLDAAVLLTTRIWDQRHEYSIRAGAPHAELGEELTPLGTDMVAGMPCHEYLNVQKESQNNRWIAQKSEVCVTHDGVLLRRIENGITTTVSEVHYGPVDPALARVPEGYRRVPAEDDTKYVPYPVLGD